MLDFAHMLRDKLEKTGKYRVAMTRSDDTFIPLADRVRISRGAQGASLFVSIHADALAHDEGECARRDRLSRSRTTPPTPRPRGSPTPKTVPT